jgi:branched-chain amino acid transport system ATP-binding protein
MNKSRKETGTPILQIDELHVSYGKIAALKGISLSVNKGEIVALLGANGAGKTTTLNAITGVIKVESGDLRLSGKSITGIPSHLITKMGICHVPEGRRIFVDLTVAENLRVASYLYESKKPRQYAERLDYVYSLFPILGSRKTQVAGTLSGGEQQMLAIGRALITGGDVLLLDEPSMGLAPIIVADIFSIIKRIAESGQTILLVEQNAMMAMEISNYCYVLETGHITYEGTPDEMKSNNNIARAYLG